MSSAAASVPMRTASRRLTMARTTDVVIATPMPAKIITSLVVIARINTDRISATYDTEGCSSESACHTRTARNAPPSTSPISRAAPPPATSRPRPHQRYARQRRLLGRLLLGHLLHPWHQLRQFRGCG